MCVSVRLKVRWEGRRLILRAFSAPVWAMTPAKWKQHYLTDCNCNPPHFRDFSSAIFVAFFFCGLLTLDVVLLGFSAKRVFGRQCGKMNGLPFHNIHIIIRRRWPKRLRFNLAQCPSHCLMVGGCFFDWWRRNVATCIGQLGFEKNIMSDVYALVQNVFGIGG